MFIKYGVVNFWLDKLILTADKIKSVVKFLLLLCKLQVIAENGKNTEQTSPLLTFVQFSRDYVK